LNVFSLEFVQICENIAELLSMHHTIRTMLTKIRRTTIYKIRDAISLQYSTK
jgi:hypothetical protein